MSEKTEYVEVTVRLPKKLVDFLKDNVKDLQKYMEYSIIQFVGADLDDLSIFPFKEPEEVHAVITRYGLNETLKATAVGEFC